MAVRGSDGAERRGTAWAISYLDHPTAITSKVLNRLSHGMLTTIGLEKKEVCCNKFSKLKHIQNSFSHCRLSAAN